MAAWHMRSETGRGASGDAPAPGQRLGHVVRQLPASHVAKAGSLQNLRYLSGSARHAGVSGPQGGRAACAGVSMYAGSAGVLVGAGVESREAMGARSFLWSGGGRGALNTLFGMRRKKSGE